MISGRQTLSYIDRALNDERGKTEAVDGRIAEISERLVEQQQALAQDYRDLARVRVDLIHRGELADGLDQAEQQVVALLRTRQNDIQDLAKQIQAGENARKELEAQRDAQAQEVDRATETLDEAEARTQARLDADPDYRVQRERAREAERTAKHADDKADRSEREKDEKAESYRSDPLFMYLWERHYGLPEYDAIPLLRWLDGKVARLVGYADARANYGRLLEIPLRLREHANGLKQKAEAEFEALRELDTQARESDGILALEQRLEQEQTRLDEIDARSQEQEANDQALLEKKAAFAAGEDEPYRRAVEYLAAEFRRDDLSQLRRDALATPFPDDDVIVSRLLDREDEQRRLEASVEDLKGTLQQHRRRLGELESVRAEFRRHRYDGAGSSFSDGALIALMLNDFLNGILDERALWRVLEQQQRYRPQRSNPTFGSGGFGRGTVWGSGRGGFGQGGFGGDLGGGSGGGRGGGFRTGGGF